MDEFELCKGYKKKNLTMTSMNVTKTKDHNMIVDFQATFLEDTGPIMVINNSSQLKINLFIFLSIFRWTIKRL